MSEAVATSQQGLVEKYQPYPEYDDSGIEWLGRIPVHWKLATLKHECIFSGGGTPTKDNLAYWGGNIPWISPKDMKSQVVTDSIDKITAVAVAESSTKLVPEGALLMVVRSGILQRTIPVAINTVPVTLNQDMKALRFKSKDKACFFLYYIQGLESQLLLEWCKQGATVESIEHELLANARYPLPPNDELKAINRFLDYETARIDRLIAHQQRLIELLKEKRQALISHAVRTRPGEGHIKLAYAINLLTGYPFASSGFKSAKDTHIPLLRGANVGVDQIKWDDVVYWDSEDCSHLDDYYLECGDIVFGMDRPWISSGARVADITQHDTPCLLLQRVARIRAKANHFQTYIKLCLSSNEFRNYVEADLTGVSVPHISPDQIKGFLIRNLPYDEQESVTKEVLQALEKLNAVEKAAFNAIELLQERRTALISAAVTGKIDLRGWTPPAEEAAT